MMNCLFSSIDHVNDQDRLGPNFFWHQYTKTFFAFLFMARFTF